MKRYGNLFEEICSIDNLKRAYKKAHKKAQKAANKKGKKAEIKRKLLEKIDSNPDFYIQELRNSLINKTYQTSKYDTYKKTDGGKVRDITDLPFFPDRIAHWAIMQVIEPLFMKIFIFDTYAAIKDRGPQKAQRRLRYFRKDKDATKYCMKLDVRKFYNSINKDILKEKLRTLIKCKDTLWLLDEIIDSYSPGIPIGNYTSQFFGNFYLTKFDHWVKEQKHIKYYLRYMDDLIILHDSKELLHTLKAEIDKQLNLLKLTLKYNWQYFPSSIRGIDYVGVRTFEEYTLLRKSTKKRMKKAMRNINKKIDNGQPLSEHNKGTYAAYNGILKNCSGYRLRTSNFAKVDKFIKEEKKKCQNGKKSKEHKKQNPQT